MILLVDLRIKIVGESNTTTCIPGISVTSDRLDSMSDDSHKYKFESLYSVK